MTGCLSRALATAVSSCLKAESLSLHAVIVAGLSRGRERSVLINIVDVVDGALVNAIALAGRRVSVAVGGMRGRRRANDLTAARWFETYRLTSEAPDLPELPPGLTEPFTEVLRGDEIQAALQELLAARLTDAPEVDAASAGKSSA